MEGKSFKEIKVILGKNFIGLDEIEKAAVRIGILIPDSLLKSIPDIPFTIESLISCKEDYLLILGIPFYKDGSELSIAKMYSHFGCNPEISEPCFYNQDWYLKEQFANSCTLQLSWYLISKNLNKNTRGKDIDSLQSGFNRLPSALLCCYIFFLNYFINGYCLWEYDYVWCCDQDINYDRVYVGRYHDPAGLNKNGFSIHRHLKIKPNYGCLELY